VGRRENRTKGEGEGGRRVKKGRKGKGRVRHETGLPTFRWLPPSMNPGFLLQMWSNVYHSIADNDSVMTE